MLDSPTLNFWIFVLEYIAMAIAMYKLGSTKLSAENPWMAWIPILQLWLLVELAELDWWYFFLFFIPIVNIFLFIYCWWRVFYQCDRAPILSILMLVPGVSVLLALYLAFTE